MLKIAICHTKPGYNGDVVIRAFKNGLLVHSDEFVEIKYFQDINKIADCDAAFMISYPDLAANRILITDEYSEHYKRDDVRGQSVINTFRTEIYKKCKSLNKRLLCLDSGVMNFERNQFANENTYQIGWDKIKGLGKYYNKGSPPDRFNKLGIEVQPWRYAGNYFLIFGQVQYGVGSQHINIYKWYADMINNIHESSPKEQMVIRPHPNATEQPFKEKKRFKLKYSTNESIDRDLDKAKLTLSFSSHSIVQSVIRGIPSFSFSQLSMGYPLFHANNVTEMLQKYENVKLPAERDVKQWLYDLAYTQWTVKEINGGVAWDHLRSHIND